MQKFIVVLTLFSCFGCPLLAQDIEGHSDIEFSYVDGVIEIEPGNEGFVFEGEFGEGLLAPNEAEAPGFASETAEALGINPGDVIGFNVLDSLYYWNGIACRSSGDTVLSIAGKGGAADTLVEAVTGLQLADFTTPANLLGQAGSDGDFHAHLDFQLSDGAETGAYGLIMSLSSDDVAIEDSGVFGIFLNFGLEQEAFGVGLNAFSTGAACIPEPASLKLIAVSLMGTGFLRRKR